MLGKFLNDVDVMKEALKELRRLPPSAQLEFVARLLGAPREQACPSCNGKGKLVMRSDAKITREQAACLLEAVTVSPGTEVAP